MSTCRQPAVLLPYRVKPAKRSRRGTGAPLVAEHSWQGWPSPAAVVATMQVMAHDDMRLQGYQQPSLCRPQWPCPRACPLPVLTLDAGRPSAFVCAWRLLGQTAPVHPGLAPSRPRVPLGSSPWVLGTATKALRLSLVVPQAWVRSSRMAPPSLSPCHAALIPRAAQSSTKQRRRRAAARDNGRLFNARPGASDVLLHAAGPSRPARQQTPMARRQGLAAVGAFTPR